MFETYRDSLGYTLQNLKKLMDLFPDAKVELPIFPDSIEWELRSKIYTILESFPRIKNRLVPEAFEYSKSSETKSGIKTKYHYENDPDGPKKMEIYKLHIEILKNYYEAIRSAEKVIASKAKHTSKEFESLIYKKDTAKQVFENSMQRLTAIWNTGAYGNKVMRSKQPSNSRKKKQYEMTANEVIDKIYNNTGRKYNIATIYRWDKNPRASLKGYPGRSDSSAFLVWLNSLEIQEQLRKGGKQGRKKDPAEDRDTRFGLGNRTEQERKSKLMR